MEEEKMIKIPVKWRDDQLNVYVKSNCNIKELGSFLQELTKVKPDTLILIVPTNESSILIDPFSDSHSNLSLRDTGIIEGKMIIMITVSEDELPKGPYVFGDFRTLSCPSIQLNPPASEALKIMHMLACDPGIIAVMNKHKWRVGTMSEMSPVKYVGSRPKCNMMSFCIKTMEEEISLRLRTDDFKGFMKYESIKKTLLHELAHMVHSEHDPNFLALNKQLNKETESLHCTSSTGPTLTIRENISSSAEEEDISFEQNNIIKSSKLGGEINPSITPSASSVNAAYKRLINSSNSNTNNTILTINKPDPDDGLIEKNTEEMVMDEPDPDDSIKLDIFNNYILVSNEPDPDETIINNNNEEMKMDEPDPDEKIHDILNINVPDPDDKLIDKNTEEINIIMDEPDYMSLDNY